MYNPNSPIINNMHNNGMQPNGCIPSMPIGNIGYNTGLQIGGYNGGFYNGVYNNYYNPYLQAQLEKQREEQHKQNLINQGNIYMKMSRAAHTATGSNIDESTLQQMYQPHKIDYSEQYKSDMEYEDVKRRRFAPRSDVYIDTKINQEIQKIRKENEKYVREDMSFEEFCKNSANLLYDINVQQSQAQQRDLSRLYNKSDYSKLVANGYNNNLFRPEVTLDDMSVFPSLGSKLKQEYAIRKQQFMDAILNNSR